jgi:hypothetical protein
MIVMRSPKTYFRLALTILILFGIVLPFAFGVKDVRLFAFFFTFVWLVYAIALFVLTFLVRPGLRIKVVQRKNPTIIKYELRDSNQERS